MGEYVTADRRLVIVGAWWSRRVGRGYDLVGDHNRHAELAKQTAINCGRLEEDR